MMLKTNEQKLLMDEQLQKVIRIVIESFDTELVRLSMYNNDHSKHAISKTLDFYCNKDIFSFFTLLNLKEITEDIFTDAIYRDFLLNVTDRVNLSLSLEEFNNDWVINTIVQGLSNNRVDPQSTNDSLMNIEAQQSIYVNPEVLRHVLKHNCWVVMLFLVLVFFQNSQVYAGITKL